MYGKDKPALLVVRPGNRQARSKDGVTIGFAAATADFDAFHTAGLLAGGSNEGLPGPRRRLPGAYAAYLRDPGDDNVRVDIITDGTREWGRSASSEPLAGSKAPPKHASSSTGTNIIFSVNARAYDLDLGVVFYIDTL